MVALQISRYNPLRKVSKYRRKHGDIRDLQYTDSEAIVQYYNPDAAVTAYKQKQKRLSDDEIRQVVDLHATTVLKILHENGVRIRNSGEYKKR